MYTRYYGFIDFVSWYHTSSKCRLMQHLHGIEWHHRAISGYCSVMDKEVLDKYVPHYKSMFAWDQHVMILTFSGQGMLQSSKLLVRAYLKLIMASWTSNICRICHYSIMYTWIICFSTAFLHIQSEHMTFWQISALPSFGVKLMMVAKHHSYSTSWQYLGRKICQQYELLKCPE